MSAEQAGDLGEVRARTRETVEAMQAQASEALELTRRIGKLTGGTSSSYAGMRTRVEARETLRQLLVVVRVFAEGEHGPGRHTQSGDAGLQIPPSGVVEGHA